MSGNFSELIETLDTNVVNSVSRTLDVRNHRFLALSIRHLAGAHTTHVITLQCALEDEDAAFKDLSTPASVLGVGGKDLMETIGKFVRLKVTTAEGALSTVNVIINAK